jgi:hypothetical protein
VSASDANTALSELPFLLDSIVPAAAPDGGDGMWHRYVIAQGSNVITGLRCGTRLELDAQLQEMVDKLNERAGKQRAKAKRWA